MQSPDMKKKRRVFVGELWRRPKVGTGLMVLGGCVLFYTLFGFFGAPMIAKSLLHSRLETALGRSVQIQSVKVNPFSLSIAVEGLKVEDKDGEPFFSFEKLFINLELFSIFKRAPVVRELRLLAPYARVTRTGQGTYNFSDLAGDGKSPPREDQTGGPRFSVSNMKVEGGTVHFRDRITDANHALNDVFVSVPFLSSLQEDARVPVPITLTARLDGAPVSFSAECLPFAPSRQATLSADLIGLDLPRYLPYLKLPANIQVRSCYLDASAASSLIWEADKTPDWSLTGRMGLSDVDVADPRGNTLFGVPLLDMTLGPSEPLAGRVRVERLSLQAPEVRLQRSKNGEINVMDLLPREGDDTARANEDHGAVPFDLVVDDLQLTDGRVLVSDLFPANPVDIKIAELALDAKNITTRSGDTGSVLLRFRVNEGGSVAFQGNAGISPVAADLRLNMEGVDIRPFKAYIEDTYRLDIIGGHIEVDGRITLVPPEGIEPMFRFKGEASLLDFKTVDRAKAQELLNWENLYTSDIDFSYGPAKVSVGKVALTGLYARLIIGPDGTVNILDVFGGGSEEQEPPDTERLENVVISEKESLTPLHIGTITLQGGNIQFSDRQIEPNIEANMLELGGRISGLSSDGEKPADVLLEGKLENYAPLEIKGTLNPWGKQQVADLNVLFSNIELGPFSPT